MDVFVARQPILSAQHDVVGYELLYRAGLANSYQAADGSQASIDVILSALQSVGLPTLTAGKKAFINFTGPLLQSTVPLLLPQDQVVIELLETIELDAKLLQRCQTLKAAGYTLALDDVHAEPDRFGRALTDSIDIVKIDLQAVPPLQLPRLTQAWQSSAKELLAEKVETEEAFDRARQLGFQLFQGYYFCRPTVHQGKDLPALQASLWEVIRAVQTENELDFARLATMIQSDLALTYKLLRFLNSAYFGLRMEIRSIQQALVLLGQNELRKWLTLVSLRLLEAERPAELFTTALVRAHFCENLARKAALPGQPGDYFLLGLVSLIDAILACRLEDVLAQLPLSLQLKSALVGGSSPMRCALDLICSLEARDETEQARLAAKLQVPGQTVEASYIQALQAVEAYAAYL